MNTMTASQKVGMMNFHKKTYKAYKQSGQKQNAEQARRMMINLYLEIRKSRKAGN